MAAFFARIPRSGESQCNFIGCSHDSQTRLRPLLFNLGTSILQHTHTHASISPDLRAPYIRQAKQYCFFLPLLSSSFLFLSRSGLFYFLPHALPLTPNKPIMLITTGVWKGSRAPPKHQGPHLSLFTVMPSLLRLDWFVCFSISPVRFCRPFIHLSVGLSQYISMNKKWEPPGTTSCLFWMDGEPKLRQNQPCCFCCCCCCCYSVVVNSP